MKFKKVMALALAACMTLFAAACGNNDGAASGAGSSQTESSSVESSSAEASSGTSSNEESKPPKVAVFYYTYGDTYISSVRAALDAALESAGIDYQDYDSNSSQTTQTEQVDTAIANEATLLVVNLVDSGSDDAAQNIIDKASEEGIPVIFFNRSVSEEVVSGYEKSVFVGTDYEMAGHMQGEMIGQYLLDNYDTVDLNGDGVISYVMFKGQEGNAEAIARTQFGQEDADAVLTGADKPALAFYDANNSDKYLVDQTGNWSASAATEYMQTILSQYSEANGNMVELVIANNDEMAIGALTALQTAGYNNGEGTTVIPIFGVDATDAAQAAIGQGTMTGTVKQDAVGMANTIAQIASNFINGADTFADVDADNVVGTWRVNIPYATYPEE